MNTRTKRRRTNKMIEDTMLDITAYEEMPEIDMEELLMTVTSVLSQQDMDELLEWLVPSENVAPDSPAPEPPAPEPSPVPKPPNTVAMRRLRHMR